MKLCVMRGQMRAKTAGGYWVKFVYDGDPSYNPAMPGPCHNCTLSIGTGIACFSPQCCMVNQRADRKAGGIWVPETV